eukprot:Blabericola_migrator_1__6636@NODE_334_length_9665_cov_140_658158_g270_i0_p1_GENE_NODE_334_length_9665_cov_140_658158_g270_i0NODE_334_length_9665_cov_140_658158_g270_i0_p1_ORF_typecomplete_len680_score137_28TPR_16/PF13432_6/0_00014TPR_16/PF13432_6/1_1e07TPR_16/PF13432_6/1_3e05TPR_15/PF13429_6/3_2e09TPR_15/PF13429_6/0_00021ANAPC3/PF12895_7/80ANAPC3/PF12895_7/1_4e06ANAPC3/PF12895_7/2_1e09ANAPC3/PF12895_7/1_1ANAPC3/PF12895_7/1_3e03TPR_MalT/PF17874_1/9_1e02TPR_MalT/PF17874_1/4_2e12TPR_19/PF14559_6/6_
MSTYGLIDEFKNYLETSKSIGFMLELSGRLGVKRQYQQDPIAQLVMRIQRVEDTDKSPSSTTTRLTSQISTGGSSVLDSVMETISLDEKRAKTTPTDVLLKELDPETDILETPKFTDIGEDSGPLTIDQQLFALAWANALLETTQDELTMQSVISIVREVLKLPEAATTIDTFTQDRSSEPMRSSNWLIYSYALWLRSKAEFSRSKWRERACLQMLTIEDQFKDTSPSFGHRALYAFQLDYPNIWELKLQVGHRFMQIGSTLTALQMFQDIKMWDECVQCLRVAGRKNEALDLVKEKLSENPMSLALNCSLGDLTNQPEPYVKAWDISLGSYSRAARSLGRLFFDKGNLDEAIKWFKEALTLKPMTPSTQFTYGCCLMHKRQFDLALSAFSVVTAMEPEQAEAWANMASIHVAKEQWEAAKKCIKEAAHLGQHLWRVWENYAKISCKTNDVYAVMEALERIVKLGKADTIEIWLLNYVARAVVLKHEEVIKGDATRDEAATEGLKASLRNLLERALAFFSQFFQSYSHSLPSDPKNLDPIKSCVDRYRIWTLVTQTAGLILETWEIRLKQLRHLARVVEDVCKNSPSESAGQENISSCLALLGRSLNEILVLRGSLKVKYPERALKMINDLERFVQNVSERVRQAIKESPFIPDGSETVTRFLGELENITDQTLAALTA